jgi:hypothetical protein
MGIEEAHQRNLRMVRDALAMTDQEAGPACSNVPVPPTIAMDDHFREIYCQGFRHALADVREILHKGG